MSFRGKVRLKIKHQVRYKDGHLRETRRPSRLEINLKSREEAADVQKLVEKTIDSLHHQQFFSGVVSFINWLPQEEGEDKSKVRLFAVYDVSLDISIEEDGRKTESHDTMRIVKAAPIFGDP